MGTLRAGEARNQMRKQQSRWKSGMAVTENERINREARSFAGRAGSAIMETVIMANACHSFWEADRTGQGMAGTEGELRLRQHTGVWQCLQSHEHGTRESAVATGEAIPKIGCAARNNPSSEANTMLVILGIMSALLVASNQPALHSVAEIGPVARLLFAGISARNAPASASAVDAGRLVKAMFRFSS